MFSGEIREYFSLGKIFSKALSAENQLFPEAHSQKAATKFRHKKQSVGITILIIDKISINKCFFLSCSSSLQSLFEQNS